MTIPADRMTLTKASDYLVRYYAPYVEKCMTELSPLTSFMLTQPMELKAGDRDIYTLQYSRDGSVVTGWDPASDVWANGGQSRAVRLEITPGDLDQIQGTLRLGVKDREVLQKRTAAVEDILGEQFVQLAEDAEYKARVSTIAPSGGKLAVVDGAGFGSDLTITVDGPGAQFMRPGMKICASDTGWVAEIAYVDYNNNTVTFVSSPTTTAGVVVASSVVANNDPVYLYNEAATAKCEPEFYGAATWLAEDFEAYNVDSTARGLSKWKFYQVQARVTGSGQITKDNLTNALMQLNIQRGNSAQVDMIYVHPTVEATIANLDPQAMRYNLSPGEEPDWIKGWGPTWIKAGGMRAPVVGDPMMYADRVWLMNRESFRRIQLRPFSFENPVNGTAGVWDLDDTYGVIKAVAWSSYNFACLRPFDNAVIDSITA